MIKSQHSIHIDRPVHQVFEYLRNHDNRIYWQGNLTEHDHEKIEKGSRVTEVRNVMGRRVEIQGEITEFEADQRLAFSGTGPAVKRLEYEYRLTPESGGTSLVTDLELELSDLYGIATPVIQRLTDRELGHAASTLKDILEHEEVHETVKQLEPHRHQKKKV